MGERTVTRHSGCTSGYTPERPKLRFVFKNMNFITIDYGSRFKDFGFPKRLSSGIFRYDSIKWDGGKLAAMFAWATRDADINDIDMYV